MDHINRTGEDGVNREGTEKEKYSLLWGEETFPPLAFLGGEARKNPRVEEG